MIKSNSFSKKTFNLADNDLASVSTTSKGNQTKFYKDGYWIKNEFLGYESCAEVVSSLLCSCIEGIDYVNYSFCTIKYQGVVDTQCCCSKSFLREGEEFISLGRLLDPQIVDLFALRNPKLSTEDKLHLLLSDVKSKTKLDLTDYLRNTIYLDSIILNEDRHLFNLGVVCTQDGSYKEAPIFDNGLSLLSDLNAYPIGMPTRILIRKVKSKPFSTKFSNQIKLFKNRNPKLLRVDVDRFSLITENLDFSRPYLKRTVLLAKHQLSEMEGIVWERP